MKLNLGDYGYEEKHMNSVNTADNGLIPARVTEVHKELYTIVSENGESSARLKGSVFYSENDETYPAVGDFVLIRHNPAGDSVIHTVLPRKSLFSRRNPTPGMGEQAVAANFDYVFILTSLNHDFNPRRLERYLTAAWQSGGLPVIVLTKADLCEDYSEELKNVHEIAVGVTVAAVSAMTGQGLDGLAEYLVSDKTIVLLGSSGVGKSSLVNALAGEELMKVNDVREDDSRGRHTTTHRELIRLSTGVMIIDTPGMRELGMWDVTEGLGGAFSEIEELAANCRFTDCKHGDEPGCAVKAAIGNGELPIERWNSYNKLKREAKFIDGKAAYLRAKSERGRTIEKYQRTKFWEER